MCRYIHNTRSICFGRTRTRGDVPEPACLLASGRGSHPYARGCAEARDGSTEPARRRTRTRGDVPQRPRARSCPSSSHPYARGCAASPGDGARRGGDRTRTRGDVPHDARAAVCPMRSHPCARGCAGRLSHPLAAGMVAPVRAAYLRLVDFVLRRTRTRGDVPFDIMDGRLAVQSHPYARGCAEYRHDRAPR